MFIRGSEFPHALCLHVSNGCSEFHVYSKKGWVSFQPDKDSLIITNGDLLQRWSGGQYKHVIGRPVFQGQKEDFISMALLISPPKINEDSTKHEKEKTISIGQQIIIALAFILIYNFIVYIYKKF
ncbi:unnamed protein product [Withania somnifera]